MGSRLKGLIKEFGFADGWKFYVHSKVNPSGTFYSSRYKRAFYLRPHTSDFYTFKQVFVERQYQIPIPFIPKTIVDAGANIGLATIYFAHRFPQARIVAIEPSKENFEILQCNVQGLSNVEPLCMGLWNKETHLRIIDTKSSKDSFMVKEASNVVEDGVPAISVPAIMKRHGFDSIDILKVDIEGSEKELFEENYESWLPKTKMLLIEIHDFMKDSCATSVFKAISKYNFSFSMKHENLIFLNKDLM